MKHKTMAAPRIHALGTQTSGTPRTGARQCGVDRSPPSLPRCVDRRILLPALA